MNIIRKTIAKISILCGILFTGAFLCGFGVNPYGIPETIVNENSSIIIIGDSRIVLMHDAVGNADCDWFATAGSGYNQLCEYTKIIDTMNLSGKKIVISFGINDINTLNPSLNSFFKYQNFMSTKAQEWIQKGATVYFTEIPAISEAVKNLPGCEGTNVELTNEYVKQFNSLASSGGFPKNIKFIQLNISPNQLTDGIHYNSNACVNAFCKIIAQ